MNILLIDTYSAEHIGNLALVDSALEQLKVKFPEAGFTILAFDPVSIEQYSGCKTLETLWAEQFSGFTRSKKIIWVIRESTWVFVNIFNFTILKPLGIMISPKKYTFSKRKLAALKAYAEADIVVSLSGEALQDNQWKRIPFFLFGYWLAHCLGKIVVIFPQSIGPLKKRFIRFMASYVLNLCDLVMPRDELSLKTVQQLKIKPGKVYLVPDVAISQAQISPEEAKKILETEGVNFNKRPLVGMSISKWAEIDYESYFLSMKELCRLITDELKGTVVFFLANRAFKKDAGDWGLTSKLHEALHSHDNAILLSKAYTPHEFKGMLGQMDLFISTRMHVAILATMAGTPTITINTQPKLRGYMNLIQQSDRSCELGDFTIIKAKELLKDSLAHSEIIRAALKDIRGQMHRRSQMASSLLRMIYDQRIYGS